MKRTATTILTCGLWLASTLVQAGTESRQAADALSRKIASITQNAAARDGVRPARTTLTEEELNSWFAFRSGRYLPAGVSRPSVTLLGGGALRGVATLDLERLASRRARSAFDPLAYLGGRVPVTVTGTLKAQDGKGQFDVQSAEVSGIPVPKFVVQELLSLYAVTPEQPEGISLDDPFVLPAAIQRIDVGRGQMTVVQ